MTDRYIRWLLIVTGVFTASSVGVFLQPVKPVALPITGAGVLLIFAAFNPPLRFPMMALGVIEPRECAETLRSRCLDQAGVWLASQN
jgi:hypothetical protein